MHRASHSAIGLPSRLSIASLMLGFLMPADVRRSFTLPPGVGTADENVLRPADPYAVQTAGPLETHRVGLDPVSRPLASSRNTHMKCGLPTGLGYFAALVAGLR